jgi:hypothetical protein
MVLNSVNKLSVNRDIRWIISNGSDNINCATFSRGHLVCWDSSGVYHGSGQMDHGGETLVCLVGAHGDAFELLELAEEVLDEMPPFVHLLVDARASRSAISASKANPSMSGGTPTVSKRCPGTKRTRLPSASVSARILVVMPRFERPIAWL